MNAFRNRIGCQNEVVPRRRRENSAIVLEPEGTRKARSKRRKRALDQIIFAQRSPSSLAEGEESLGRHALDGRKRASMR